MSLNKITCWLRPLTGAIAYLLIATDANAHFNAPGLSNFNAGVLHPLLTVQHAMVLIAFGLLCGQRGATHLRFGLPGLAAGLLLGFRSRRWELHRPAASLVL